MKDKICVLVNSCDKYEDAWDPFFYFFNKFWKCPYKIYLNTETKKYNNMGVITLNSGTKNLSWSCRLKNALKKIKSKYIVFLLEDFFFLDYVNQERIQEYIKIMDKDKSIAVIDFEHCLSGKQITYRKCKDLCERINQVYLLSCQAAIWRKKDLIRFLSPYETPWQMEIFGTERVKLYNKKFLLLDKNADDVFKYNVNWKTGYGIHNGKWLKSNIELFRQNNINVNFNNLGFCDDEVIINNTVYPPRVMLKERLMYLLFSGGDICPRLSLRKQMGLLFNSPKKYYYLQKHKIIRCFRKNFH